MAAQRQYFHRPPVIALASVAGIGSILVQTLAIAAGVVSIQPPLVRPDANGVARFTVQVTEVPEPGLRSYALDLEFEGYGIRLVNRIDSVNDPLPEDAVTCAARLGSTGASETIVPEVATLLSSGQGDMVLDAAGGGAVLAAGNRVEGTVAHYNFGVAGALANPQTGDGTLLDMRCYVGTRVPAKARVRVTPGLHAGAAGAVFLDRPGAAPVLHRFRGGQIIGRNRTWGGIIMPRLSPSPRDAGR
jgi:hypothetical protein